MPQADEVVDILLQIKQDQRAIKQMQGNFKDLQSSVVSIDRGLKKAFSFSIAGSAVFAGAVSLRRVLREVTDFGSRGVNFSAIKEQSEVAFETLLGDAGDAKERVEELIDFAARTPFRLPGIIDANRQLQVLTDGALAGEEGLRIIGDAAAATGRDMSQVAFWVGRTFAGLKTGTPVGEATLRLIEMGLASGDTALELQRLAQEARSSDEAFEIIRETFSKTENAMERQSRTFKGLQSTMADTLDVMASDLSRPIFDALKEGMEELLELVGALPTEVELARRELRGLSKTTVASVLGIDDIEAVPDKLDAVDQKLIEIQRRSAKIRLALDNSLKSRENTIGPNESFSALDVVQTEILEFGRKLNDSALRFLGQNVSEFTDESLENTKRLRNSLNDLTSQESKLMLLREQLEGVVGPKTVEEAERLEKAIARIQSQGKIRIAQGERSSRFDEDSGLTESETERLNILREEQLLLTRGIEARAKANAFSRDQNTELQKAKTLEKDLVEGAATIQSKSESVAKQFELQSVSLREQEKLLVNRLVALKERAVVENELLDLTGSEEAKQKSIQKINTERKQTLLELFKVQKKLDEEEEQSLRENFDLRAKSEKLLLDQVKHQKELLALDGVSVTEREEMFRLVEEEKKAIQSIIDLRRVELSMVTDPARRAAIESEIQNLEQARERASAGSPRFTRFEQSQVDFAERDDPENAFADIQEAGIAAILDFQTQAGTVVDVFHSSLIDIQDTMQGGLSDSIQGLINQTMTWGEAIDNVRTAIGTSLVRSIADMASAWILNQVRMLAFSKAFKAAETTAGVAQGAALAAALTPAATLATIATFGSAAGTAALVPAAVASNQSAILGLSAIPGLRDGGLVSGPEQLIRINEEGEEFVVRNRALRTFGTDFFQGINDGRITPRTFSRTEGGGSGGGESQRPIVKVGVFSKMQDVEEFFRSSEGENLFIDLSKQTKDQVHAY